MKAFDYTRANDAAEAVQRHGGGQGTEFLAGGLSLVPAMKAGRAAPAALVDISRIEGLAEIRADGDTLIIGAGATHAQVATDATVAQLVPALNALANGIGHPQVRHLGTLGGTLATADPVTDWPPALLALRAIVVTDRREIEAAAFFRGPYSTALEAGELITAVRFPRCRQAAYRKYENPASRYAMAGAFVARGAQRVRVAVTGAATTFHREPLLEQALTARFTPDAARDVVLDSSRYIDDLHGDPTYRAQLVRTMAARAVEAING
ncbi:MAG: FAD binding domain-containing protein [Pseudomonadota bacterium]